MVVGFIVGVTGLVFSLYHIALHGIFVFLWILFIVIFMVYQSYFESIYVRLVKKSWLLNLVSAVSFTIFSINFFIGDFSIIFPVLAIFVFWMTVTHFKKEMSAIISRLRNATSNDFLHILKDLSTEHTESEVIHQYIIKNYNIMKIMPALLRELDAHKMLGTIKDYECIIEKRKIKINAIL